MRKRVLSLAKKAGVFTALAAVAAGAASNAETQYIAHEYAGFSDTEHTMYLGAGHPNEKCSTGAQATVRASAFFKGFFSFAEPVRLYVASPDYRSIVDANDVLSEALRRFGAFPINAYAAQAGAAEAFRVYCANPPKIQDRLPSENVPEEGPRHAPGTTTPQPAVDCWPYDPGCVRRYDI